jgi:hypothetical protein
MPINESFSMWFNILSEWLSQKQLVKRYHPFESDIKIDFSQSAEFEKILHSNILQAHPILKGARLELTQHVLSWLSNPENLERDSYASLSHIFLVWNELPLVILANTKQAKINEVSLVIDLARLATKVYLLPVNPLKEITVKRWKLIAYTLIFLGASTLLNDNVAS